MKWKCSIAMVAACPFPCPRGTPIRIFRMAEALARHGMEVHVVTYNMGESSNSFPFHVHRTFQVKTYNKLSPGPSLQKLFLLDPLLSVSLANVFKRYDIDIVHAHHYEGLVVSLAARKRLKIPIIYDAHTMLESEMPFYKIGLPMRAKAFLGKFLDSSLPKYANHIITVTEDIKKKLTENSHISEEKVSVIMNGVENDYFATNLEKMRNGKEKILIYTGNMAEFQGIDLLLKAFRILHQKRDDVRLSIVTDASFAPYQALANELGIMPYMEIVPSTFSNLPQYLGMADVALNPRLVCDGIPQKLLNYMSAGKPIVSFAGSAKVLTHQETGYVVQGKSSLDFAEGMLYVLEHPELMQKMGRNAQMLSHTEYGWDNVAEKTIQLYHHILNH